MTESDPALSGVSGAKRVFRSRWIGVAAVVAALLLLVAILGLAMFPVGLLRGEAEARLSKALDTQVRVGAVTRDTLFSFNPTIAVRDVRIAQPAWVGQGDFVRLRSAKTRVSIWALLTGGFRPDRIDIEGMQIALVQREDGRRNWRPEHKRERSHDGPNPLAQLTSLSISDTRFSLDDRKRGLRVAGLVTVDDSGLTISGTGEFLGTPANVAIRGAAVLGHDPAARYPMEVKLDSPALTLAAKLSMDGVLDLRHFDASLSANAPTLKNLDRVIEAGLFGTRPIAVKATVRHDGHDWRMSSVGGAIGRTRFAGKATVLKRDGRTRLDADLHATTLDFDDLADDAGRARARAKSARIGQRVVPDTRINLSKIGATDGRIAFVADRLLSRDASVFRSARGVLTLDHRLARLTQLRVGMTSGHLTGAVTVDHRSGAPKLTLDLRIEDSTLEQLIGAPATVRGAVRGRVLLTGSGDTIRAALSRANGRAAIVADHGSVTAIVAAVLGQDLTGTIGKAIDGGNEPVPLRCMVANFRAANGVLTPDPLAIDAGKSIGQGSGRITLDGENVTITLRGHTTKGGGLRIVDPIRIGGTLSAPTISVAGLGRADKGKKPSVGSVLKVFGKSIGSALGIGGDHHDGAKTKAVASPLPCAAMTASALR